MSSNKVYLCIVSSIVSLAMYRDMYRIVVHWIVTPLIIYTHTYSKSMLNGMYMYVGLHTEQIIQLILVYQNIKQYIELNGSEK